MALLIMIGRKMLKNKWLELSLLLGLILSVALVASMPIYTNAILHRMLIKDLELIQTNENKYPGNLTFSFGYSVEKPETRLRRTPTLDQIIVDAVDNGFQVPMHHSIRERRSTIMALTPVLPDGEKVSDNVNRQGDIVALEDVESHIRLIDGRMPAKEPVDGVIETLITQRTIFDLKLSIGGTYEMRDFGSDATFIVMPVGVFDVKEEEDLYWSNMTLNTYARSMLIPFETFENFFTFERPNLVRALHYNLVLDYSKMEIPNVDDYLTTYQRVVDQFNAYSYHSKSSSTALKTISVYEEREAQLRALLWSMNVPVMIMLAFYLYMVANLIMDRQKTEIAVLRSRGASRLQIMTSFFIEGVILSAIAIAVGPPLGMMLTKILGASNGFLEFVQRSAMLVKLDRTAYIYGLYAVGFGMLMMLIPGFFATRISIVGHKQQMARKQKTSLWHKLFLDVILIAISLYGLTNFNRRMKELSAAGLDAASFSIDPLLFLVPTLFTVGFGLFCLRLYPLFIRVVYWLGRRWWPPSLYQTLIQVGRSSTQYQFLMIFLIMTIATGLFSASAARTMNQNNEDKINYQFGADVVMEVFWDNDAPPPPPPGAPPPKEPIIPKRVQYVEPAYETIFKDLPGVEHTAKVFNMKKATISGDGFGTETQLIGIDTDDFGRTTWFKDGLLDHHLNDYLNLIALEPTAILISRSLADQYDLKPGDQVYLGWELVESRKFMVYGIVDYFPTYKPHPDSPGAPLPKLVVGHLSAIQTLLAVEPYEVWIKLSPNADRQALVDEFKEREVRVTRYVDVVSELINVKNDPFNLAINGVMTLGFIISIIVSFCGFLLYWVLSLHGRILQIGIFRAMGISFKQLVYMLAAEQVLTSGAGIVIGLANGVITSRLFVKFFQLTVNPATQVPPFEVVFDARDTTGIFIVVTVMIVGGLSILAYLLSRIRIHQAVKLGED